ALGDPRGNGDGEHPLTGYPPLAAARAARITVEAACAAAGGTGTRHGEEALGEAHLALPAAGAASLRRRPLLLTGAATGLTALVTGDLELGLHSPRRFFQGDFEPVLEILTPPGTPTTPTATPAEEALEEILEDGAEASVARSPEARDRAKPIVLGALVGIGEHGVGFADLLEPLLGVAVPRVLVGMVLAGEGAVGLLQ